MGKRRALAQRWENSTAVCTDSPFSKAGPFRAPNEWQEIRLITEAMVKRIKASKLHPSDKNFLKEWTPDLTPRLWMARSATISREQTCPCTPVSRTNDGILYVCPIRTKMRKHCFEMGGH